MSRRTDGGKAAPGRRKTARRHLRTGWWCLLGFLTRGFVLETLHGFKAGFYLDVSNSTRRLMWTLAHAHGALFSVLNIVFALSLRALPQWRAESRTLASRCLIGALALVPLGFFLGGFFIRGGDPGLGVLLVPPGAVLLFVGVYLTARATKDSVP